MQSEPQPIRTELLRRNSGGSHLESRTPASEGPNKTDTDIARAAGGGLPSGGSCVGERRDRERERERERGGEGGREGGREGERERARARQTGKGRAESWGSPKQTQEDNNRWCDKVRGREEKKGGRADGREGDGGMFAAL